MNKPCGKGEVPGLAIRQWRQKRQRQTKEAAKKQTKEAKEIGGRRLSKCNSQTVEWKQWQRQKKKHS